MFGEIFSSSEVKKSLLNDPCVARSSKSHSVLHTRDTPRSTTGEYPNFHQGARAPETVVSKPRLSLLLEAARYTIHCHLSKSDIRADSMNNAGYILFQCESYFGAHRGAYTQRVEQSYIPTKGNILTIIYVLSSSIAHRVHYHNRGRTISASALHYITASDRNMVSYCQLASPSSSCHRRCLRHFLVNS